MWMERNKKAGFFNFFKKDNSNRNSAYKSSDSEAVSQISDHTSSDLIVGFLPPIEEEAVLSSNSTSSDGEVEVRRYNLESSPKKKAVSYSSTTFGDVVTSESITRPPSPIVPSRIRSESGVSVDGQIMLSIQKCIKKIYEGWEEIRMICLGDPQKYLSQIKFMDYVHDCEQAKMFLASKNYDDALIYCDNVKLSDHWYVYSIKADIYTAMGKDSKAQTAANSMRLYMKKDNHDTPESVALYYGFRVATKREQGDEKAAQYKCTKAIKILKTQQSENAQTSSSSDSQDAGNIPSILTSFEAARGPIEDMAISHKFTLSRSARIKKYSPSSSDESLRDVVDKMKINLIIN